MSAGQCVRMEPWRSRGSRDPHRHWPSALWTGRQSSAGQRTRCRGRCVPGGMGVSWDRAGRIVKDRAATQPNPASPVRQPVAAAESPFSASGRERPKARIGGEKRRDVGCRGRGAGRSGAVLVHSSGQSGLPAQPPQRRLSAECAMARARQRWGRDEFETYDWWCEETGNRREHDLWTTGRMLKRGLSYRVASNGSVGRILGSLKERLNALWACVSELEFGGRASRSPFRQIATARRAAPLASFEHAGSRRIYASSRHVAAGRMPCASRDWAG